MVKMTQVPDEKSTAIGAHGYDAATRILEVHFKKAKKVYHYHDVGADAADKFAKAVSLGEHHAEFIKGKYHHTSVDA